MKSFFLRHVHFDQWGTGDWKVGFGWWDGAFELYLGRRILVFSKHPASLR
ncbi:hypothetical protein [Litorisediminicola beolgyonensis]|uniref:Uncharacterized protein n=1 Tax=Litorisediminicola beolgyonensis TaxID=1173614 RepID=A0ABW3ZIB3_9RHOB